MFVNMASLGGSCELVYQSKRDGCHPFTVTIRVSRVNRVMVSVRIRDSLLLVIGLHRTSRREVSRIMCQVPDM